jgi:mono/diheme cytochrome c family protein
MKNAVCSQLAYCLLPAAYCLLLTGCRQQMASQPAYRPLVPSALFADNRSARPLVAGTVPRGELRDDPHFFTGRKPRQTQNGDKDVKEKDVAATGNDGPEAYFDAFPVPIVLEDPTNGADKKQVSLERGRERFNIFCAPCHDRVGTGQGMIVQRGFTAPPSLHTDLSRGFKLRGFKVPLREAPVGYYYDVITNGFGAMPKYNHQIPPFDRWAIIAYIKALQVSQGATAEGKVKQSKP